MMKHCLLIAVLLFSISSNAQQKERKNAVYLGLGSYMISQENKLSPQSEYRTIKEFRPSVDLFYNRLIWMGLGVGIGYSFKNADPNAHLTTGELISCTEQFHALLLSVNYKIGFNSLSVTPFVSIGPGFVRFKFTDTYPVSYTTDYHNVVVYSPGIRLGYDFKRLVVFMSYNYDYYKCSPKINMIVIGTWTFPHEFGHHCVKAGLGWYF